MDGAKEHVSPTLCPLQQWAIPAPANASAIELRPADASGSPMKHLVTVQLSGTPRATLPGSGAGLVAVGPIFGLEILDDSMLGDCSAPVPTSPLSANRSMSPLALHQDHEVDNGGPAVRVATPPSGGSGVDSSLIFDVIPTARGHREAPLAPLWNDDTRVVTPISTYREVPSLNPKSACVFKNSYKPVDLREMVLALAPVAAAELMTDSARCVATEAVNLSRVPHCFHPLSILSVGAGGAEKGPATPPSRPLIAASSSSCQRMLTKPPPPLPQQERTQHHPP